MTSTATKTKVKNTLENDIKKMIDRIFYKSNIGEYVYDSFYDTGIRDVYGKVPSSAPLQNEERKQKIRVEHSKKCYEVFQKAWTKLERILNTILGVPTKNLGLHEKPKCIECARLSCEEFIKNLARITGRILTEKQTCRLCGGMLVYHTEQPINTVAKKLQVSRNTIKKWVDWIEDYDEAVDESWYP